MQSTDASENPKGAFLVRANFIKSNRPVAVILICSYLSSRKWQQNTSLHRPLKEFHATPGTLINPVRFQPSDMLATSNPSILTHFLSTANLCILVIAISPNNNEIHIYETTNWTRLFLLSEVKPTIVLIIW